MVQHAPALAAGVRTLLGNPPLEPGVGRLFARLLQTANQKYITPSDLVHIARPQNSSRSTQRKLLETLDVEGVMRKIFRIAVIVGAAIALAGPLLFSGTATFSDNRGSTVKKSDPVYSDWARGKRELLLW
jgi:hypothetical protein